MTHIHTKFFSSIIHIFESARNPLHFSRARVPHVRYRSIARSQRIWLLWASLYSGYAATGRSQV